MTPIRRAAQQAEEEPPMQENGRSQAIYTRLFFVVMAILVSITSATTGWLLLTVIAHGNEITIIKSNRFTVNDAQSVWASISEIRTNMAKLPTSSEPPPWLLSRLDRIEATMESIEGKFDALRETMAAVRNSKSEQGTSPRP